MIIEDVQIGLDNAGKYYYEDTGEILEDGDLAYVINSETAMGDEPVYFNSEEAAKEYIKENELDE